MKGEKIAFELEAYNKSLPLVIDPLIFSTYLGGAFNEQIYELVLNDVNEIYCAGLTSSPDFPVTPGVYDNILNGVDGYISKFNSNASMLTFSTFVGGTGFDFFRSLQIYNNELIVLGLSYSNDYPVTPSAYDLSFNGGADIVMNNISRLVILK